MANLNNWILTIILLSFYLAYQNFTRYLASSLTDTAVHLLIGQFCYI